MSPVKSFYDEALQDVLLYKHWDNMVVFYDESFGKYISSYHIFTATSKSGLGCMSMN